MVTESNSQFYELFLKHEKTPQLSGVSKFTELSLFLIKKIIQVGNPKEISLFLKEILDYNNISTLD